MELVQGWLSQSWNVSVRKGRWCIRQPRDYECWRDFFPSLAAFHYLVIRCHPLLSVSSQHLLMPIPSYFPLRWLYHMFILNDKMILFLLIRNLPVINSRSAQRSYINGAVFYVLVSWFTPGDINSPCNLKSDISKEVHMALSWIGKQTIIH